MAESTLSRAALLRYFTESVKHPGITIAVEAALAGLGWAEKQEFTRDDALALTWRMASDAQLDMSASPNPEVAEAGDAMKPMIDLTRRYVAQVVAPNV